MKAGNVKFWVVFGFVMILLANNASASTFGLPRCNEFNFFGLCCNDQCWQGQLKCNPDGQSAKICGDYDTLADFDICYEFPPDGFTQFTQTCKYGCSVREGDLGDTCITSDPCAGIGCNPGDTRCGRKCPEGQSCMDAGSYTDATYMCKKLTIGGVPFECYGWDFQNENAKECPYGCYAGNCLDENQHDCSTCVPGLSECDDSGFYVRECVDPDQDRCFHLEDEPFEWTNCPNGCAQDFSIDGTAYCKNAGGGTDCNKCVFGGDRCNPNEGGSDPRYVQRCWDSNILGCNQWTTDYSRFVEAFGGDIHKDYGFYCPFGCHLGRCRANPAPPVEDEDTCADGTTRCAGDGDSMQYCQYDSITENYVWGNQKKCLSGKCQGVECVISAGKAFDGTTVGGPSVEIIQTPAMAADERYLYMTVMFSDGVLRPGIMKYDVNGTYNDFCNLSALDSGITLLPGIEVLDGEIYITKNSSAVLVLDSFCSLGSTITLTRNATIGGSQSIASNGTNLFILGNGTDGINVYDMSGTYEYSICLWEPSFTLCAMNQHDFTILDNRIYALHALDSSTIATFEIYGTNGYWFSNETLTPPSGHGISDFSNYLSGITDYQGRLIILWSKLQQSSAGLFSVEKILQNYYLDRSCKDTCNEGGSHCVGNNKEYVSKCIETNEGCWKYFDEVGHLFPAGTADTYQESCGSTQCKERWENHYIIKAFCDDDVSCEDVCDEGEYGCDSQIYRGGDTVLDQIKKDLQTKYTGSRYKVKCIKKPSPIPFNLGRECFGWADPSNTRENTSNYEFCGTTGTCIDGQCVPRPNECSLGESHCEYFGEAEYVTDCIDSLGRLVWSPTNILNSSEYCEWGCNETFFSPSDSPTNATINKRNATCRLPSIEQKTVIGIKNAVAEFEQSWNIMWPDDFSQMFITILLSLGTFIMLIKGGWQLSAGGAGAVFLLSLATGWLGAVIAFFIFLLLALIILPKFIDKEG